MGLDRGKRIAVSVGGGAAVVALLIFAVGRMQPAPPESAERVASSGSLQAPVSRQPASAVANKTPSSEAARAASQYFHRELAGLPAVDRIYRSVMNRLPPGEDSELLAVYVAEGIARNGSSGFAHFMGDLHAGLRDRSLQLFDLMSAREASFKQDPFTYQMTLNLAAHLQLPGELKAQLLGDAMDIHFATDPTTGVTAMSANITNALILMKNNGITAAQAAPYIQHGVQVNQDDPQALAEFAARANTYYPGSVSVR